MSLQNSHQISDVKVMLVKGIDGNGIASIEKTSSQGLVDVYTITYTNGERSTFTVTNGAGGGMSALIMISSDAGSDVSVVAPSGRVLQVEQVSGSSTLWQCETTEYGTHNIFSVLSDDEVQVNLNVDACKIYTVDESHFHADITATFPSGASCSCGKSGETPVYATENPFTFTVHNAGEYIITVEAYGQTFTETVTITTSGQEESVSLPVGSTVTPTDDVGILLACAMIGDSEITTIAGLLADSTTLSAVIASQNAIDYLVRSTTFASDVTADQTAMSYIGLNNYASNTLTADSTWNNAIQTSTYFESVDNVKVPIMTSATAPSGEVFCNSQASDRPAYYAFAGYSTSSTYGWETEKGTTNNYITYDFGRPVCLKRFNFGCLLGNSASPLGRTFYVQGSNDNSNFDNLFSFTDTSRPFDLQQVVNNNVSYRYYRVFCADVLRQNVASGGWYYIIANIQFYCREDVA